MEVAPDQPTKLSQVWFPGGHGCVGGGVEQERGLSDRALEWMLSHMEAIGLAVERGNIEYGVVNGQPQYGIKPAYNTPFEMAKSPLGYRTRELPAATSFTNDLDLSAKQRWHDTACKYHPANLNAKFGPELDRWTEES